MKKKKIIVSENIKVMRRSQFLELFSAKKQRQEELISEQNAIKKLKCNNLVEKEIEIKKKIDNIKKESDFVVLERKEYNLKLNKYRNSILDQLKN